LIGRQHKKERKGGGHKWRWRGGGESRIQLSHRLRHDSRI
jgi:hypothetical protein